MDLSGRLVAALEGRYEILRELGRGGMSVVFLARDLRLDREVALKALRSELTESVGAERFQREIQLVAHFEHVHLLQLHESGTANGVLYYIMPYARDGSLRDRLAAEGPLGLDEVLRVTREVADGLTHAHAQGVVHRDIKPENILFLDGHAVVADFGIAHAYSEAGGQTFTEYGIALGTPVYMSPEQAAGNPRIDERSDVYSLGCVAYEMLSGGPPFEGPTTQAVLAKHMQETVPSLGIVRPGVPAGIVQAVEKALAKVPGDRFMTAAEFAEALEAGVNVIEPPPPRPPVAAWTAGVVAVGAAVVLGWRLLFPPAPPLDPDWIVVFPLEVSGTEFHEASLGEDVATMIGHALDGTEPMRWINGSLLLEERGDTAAPLTVMELRRLARNAGAGHFTSGRIVLRQDSADVYLDLHHAATDSVVGRGSSSEAIDAVWRAGVKAVTPVQV